MNSNKIEYEKTEYINYLKSFGVEYKNEKFDVEDEKKLKTAYLKAWENRDFEINKFWTRAAYFWGFLALIFGAYFTNITKASAVNEYTPFYIICIGLIFSFAWTFVIKGSKRWQENWELHIDKLEDYVSGPLYKTINTKEKRFYSVSKINEILSYLIIVVWTAFLIEYILNSPIIDQEVKLSDLRLLIGLSITIFFIFQIVYGYGRSSVSVKGKTSRRKMEKINLEKMPSSQQIANQQ